MPLRTLSLSNALLKPAALTQSGVATGFALARDVLPLEAAPSMTIGVLPSIATIHAAIIAAICR